MGFWLFTVVAGTLAELGRECEGKIPYRLGGTRPNPRAEGRAPDDTSHWYAKDGCGKWDLLIYGPEVVAKRRAFRKRWESDARLREQMKESEKQTKSRFAGLLIVYSIVSCVGLIIMFASLSPSYLWRESAGAFVFMSAIICPLPGAVLAAITNVMIEKRQRQAER